MNFIYIFLMVLGFNSVSFADCRGPMDSEYGSFEGVSNGKATTECRSPVKFGRLDLPGCLIGFKSLNKGKNNGKIRQVYVNPEFCDLKEKKVVELWIIQECCDMTYSVLCEDHKDGKYSDNVDDSVYACKATDGYYIKEIKVTKNGKSVVRHYNRKAIDFVNLNKKNPGPPFISDEEFKKLKSQQLFPE